MNAASGKLVKQKDWPRGILAVRAALVLVSTAYFMLLGGPLGPDWIGPALLAAGVAYLIGCLGVGLLRSRAWAPVRRSGQIVLDNAICLAVVPFDPASSMPLLLLTAANPLDASLRKRLYGFGPSLLATLLVTAGILYLRASLDFAPLTVEPVAMLLIAWAAVAYGLVNQLTEHRLRAEYDNIYERHRAAMRGVRFATWVWRLDEGGTDSINPELDALLGQPPGSYDGKISTLLSFVHPEDRARVQASASRIVAGGEGFEIRFRHFRADGRIGWLASRGEPLDRDDNGNTTSVSGVLWDVTAEVEARERTDQALARIDEVARTTGIGFWSYDVDTGLFDFDVHWRDSIGLGSAHKPVLAELLTHVDANYRDAIESKFHEAVEKARGFDFEMSWRRPADGRELFLRGRGVPGRDHRGRVVEIYGVVSDDTEAHRAALEFNALRERHDRNLRAARVTAWSWDIHTDLLEFDAHVAEAFGTPARLDGQSLDDWLDLIQENDRQRLQQQLNNCAHGLGSVECRYRVHAADGQTQWLYTRAEAVVTEDDGRTRRIGGFTANVTAEMTAREAARIATEKIDSVLDTGRFGFWSLNWETRRFDVDRGWHAMTGYSRQAAQPDFDTIMASIHPVDRPRLETALEQTLTTGQSFSLELRATRFDDDRPYDFAAHGRALTGANGAIVGAAGYMIDRSEVALAQREASETLARVETAAEAANIGFWRLDADSRSIELDHNAYRLIGAPENRDIRHVDDALALIHETDRVALREQIQRALARGHRLTGEFRSRHRETGEWRYMYLRGDEVFDKEGEFVGLAGFVHDHTDVTLAEARAKHARQLLDRALSTTRMVAFMFNAADQQVEFAGDLSLLEPLGIPLPVTDFETGMKPIHPEHRETLRKKVARALETGEAFEDTHQVRYPDGQDRWLHLTGRPLLDDRGVAVGLAGLLLDRTEIACEQQTAEMERARYDAALMAAGIGAWTWDIDADAVFVDRHLAGLLGLGPGPASLRLEDFLAALDRRDRTSVRQALERARTPGHSADCQFRITADAGQPGWFMLRGESVQRDARGSGPRVAGAIWDVSRLVEGQRAETLYRERHDHALRYTNIACWNWIAESNRLTYDPWAPALMGTTHEAVGTTMDGFYAAVTEEDRQRIMDDFSRILASDDDRYDLEFRARNALPQTRWFRTTGQIQRDDDGAPNKVYGILQDVSSELQLRHELQRSNEELDSFAQVASHDLREPLRGLQGYAALLHRRYGEQMDESGRQMLDALKQLSARLHDLIEDLLQFSRFGHTQLAIENTEMQALTQDVLSTLHFMLDSNGVTVRIPAELPSIHCDRVRVAELMRNLIANAAKYNDQAEKWVEIGHADGVFHVRDNGIGIDPAHHEEIFGIFRRLHDREAFGGGTGAGLAIAERIVHQHGGRIWLESEAGRGSTFYFTLAAEPIQGAVTGQPVRQRHLS